MTIETRYFVSLHLDEEKSDSYEDDFDSYISESLFFNPNVNDINVFSGNAACSPYLEFWCESDALAKTMQKAFINDLKRWGLILEY